MQPTSKYSMGIRFGLITGLVYALLLFVRYHFLATSPITFNIAVICTYLIILLFYLFAGISRKKELSGYADFKDIFRTIFITILIVEAVYIIFNSVYLKYIDPSFFDHFRSTTRDYYERHGLRQDQIDAQMKNYDTVFKEMSPVELVKGFGSFVIVDSIIGMIYAAVLRKKKDILKENKL